MMRVIVADDEPVARRRIARLLRAEPGVAVIAECSGGLEAVARVTVEQPDLVFLDVQMPDLNGIEAVQRIGVDRMPPVVFVTAFDQYAIKAFELNAVDYLLKPYDTERFQQALARARKRIEDGDAAARSRDLQNVIQLMLAEKQRAESDQQGSSFIDRIALKVEGAMRIVRIADVDWFETDGNYVRVHIGKIDHPMRGTIAELERQLHPERFVRVHRRHIVNLDRVAEVQPWFAGDAIIILRDGTKLRVSRTHRATFQSRLLKQLPIPTKVAR
jgi:two-component system, LytTR family, response regulator